MSVVNYSNMKGFLKENRGKTSFQNYLKDLSQLESMNLGDISLSNLHDECRKINLQKSKKGKKGTETGLRLLSAWRKGEFKIFTWFLTFYLFCKDLTPLQLTKNDFQFFQSIFILQSPQRLQYETNCLFLTSRDLKRSWDEEEVHLLKQIIEKTECEEKKLQWKGISFQLYACSQQKYFRTYGQCREMWINHLNPQVIKKNWTIKEDLQLLELVQQIGKQWSKICSRMIKRSDHMIKNRYNALIRQYKKKYSKENEALCRAIEELKFSQQSFEQNPAKSFYNNQYQNSQKIIQDFLSKKWSFPPIMFPGDELKERKELKINGMIQSSTQKKNIDEGPSQNQIWVPNLLLSMNAQRIYPSQLMKPVMLDLTQKLGFSHVEQVDLLFQLQNEGRIPSDLEFSF